MKKVSIVVPAYNAEKTLRYCIESIQGQSYKDIEIIIVNDGSTDSTLSLAKELQRSDSRIVVESKSNGGVSSARNLGLKCATGTYITFVDSDDKLKPEMVDQLLKACDSDIVVSDVYQREIAKFGNGNTYSAYYDLSDLRNEFSHLYESNFFNSVCGKLYKMQGLENIFFDEDVRIGEDLLFNFEAFKKAKRVATINYCGYVYVPNIESATHKFDSADFEQQKLLRDKAKEFGQCFLNADTVEKAIDSVYLRNIVDVIVNLVTYMPSSEAATKLHCYLTDKDFTRIARKYKTKELHIDLKRKAFVWLLQRKFIAVIMILGSFNRVRHKVNLLSKKT